MVADNIRHAKLDVTSETDTIATLSHLGATHVINASSYGVHPEETDFAKSVKVNTWGTYTLVSAASQAGVKRFIQVGSYFEYAHNAKEISENAPLSFSSLYADTKSAASLILNDRRLCGGMETVIARAFHLWGAREAPHRLTAQVINACATRTPLKLTEGVQIKDFTYVSDAAAWISALTLRSEPLPHSIYNIAGGRRCSVREFVTCLASRLDGTELMHFGEKTMPGRESPYGLANTSRLRSTLGSMVPTPFEEVVRQTLTAAGAI